MDVEERKRARERKIKTSETIAEYISSCRKRRKRIIEKRQRQIEENCASNRN